MAAFLGIRGTGSFSANERPDNFRQKVFKLWPNGDAPLVALMSKLKNEAVDSMTTWWFQKRAPEERLLVDVGGAAPGDTTINVKNSAALSYNKGTQLMNWTRFTATGTAEKVRMSADPTNASQIVVDRNIDLAGAQAWLEDDVLIGIGGTVEEGGNAATAISTQPDEEYNHIQSISDTAEVTWESMDDFLRTDPRGPSAELLRETLQRHTRRMEMAAFYGPRVKTAVGGNKYRYETGGIHRFLTAHVAANPTATNIKTWTGGNVTQDALWAWFEDVFRYGSRTKAWFVGSHIPVVLNQFPMVKANLNTVPETKTYGMDVTRLKASGGDLMLIQHPIFSQTAELRSTGFILDMENLSWLHKRNKDTKLIPHVEAKGSHTVKAEYFSTFGIRVVFPETHFFTYNFQTAVI